MTHQSSNMKTKQKEKTKPSTIYKVGWEKGQTYLKYGLKKKIEKMKKPFPDIRHLYQPDAAELIETRIEVYNQALTDVLKLLDE